MASPEDDALAAEFAAEEDLGAAFAAEPDVAQPPPEDPAVARTRKYREMADATARAAGYKDATHKPTLGRAIKDSAHQGLTLGFGDNVVAFGDALGASLFTGQKFGDTYEQTRNMLDAQNRYNRQEHPVATGVTEAVTGLVPTLATGAIGKGAQAAKTGVELAKQGALLGGLAGGASALGHSENVLLDGVTADEAKSEAASLGMGAGFGAVGGANPYAGVALAGGTVALKDQLGLTNADLIEMGTGLGTGIAAGWLGNRFMSRGKEAEGLRDFHIDEVARPHKEKIARLEKANEISNRAAGRSEQLGLSKLKAKLGEQAQDVQGELDIRNRELTGLDETLEGARVKEADKVQKQFSTEAETAQNDLRKKSQERITELQKDPKKYTLEEKIGGKEKDLAVAQGELSEAEALRAKQQEYDAIEAADKAKIDAFKKKLAEAADRARAKIKVQATRKQGEAELAATLEQIRQLEEGLNARIEGAIGGGSNAVISRYANDVVLLGKEAADARLTPESRKVIENVTERHLRPENQRHTYRPILESEGANSYEGNMKLEVAKERKVLEAKRDALIDAGKMDEAAAIDAELKAKADREAISPEFQSERKRMLEEAGLEEGPDGKLRLAGVNRGPRPEAPLPETRTVKKLEGQIQNMTENGRGEVLSPKRQRKRLAQNFDKSIDDYVIGDSPDSTKIPKTGEEKLILKLTQERDLKKKFDAALAKTNDPEAAAKQVEINLSERVAGAKVKKDVKAAQIKQLHEKLQLLKDDAYAKKQFEPKAEEIRGKAADKIEQRNLEIEQRKVAAKPETILAKGRVGLQDQPVGLKDTLRNVLRLKTSPAAVLLSDPKTALSKPAIAAAYYDHLASTMKARRPELWQRYGKLFQGEAMGSSFAQSTLLKASEKDQDLSAALQEAGQDLINTLKELTSEEGAEKK